MILSGRLLGPIGEPLANARLSLTAKRTSLGVLKFSTQEFKTDRDGRYQIDVPFGVYGVSFYDAPSRSFRSLGTIVVSEETDADRLSEMLMVNEAVPSPTEAFTASIQKAAAEVREGRDEAVEAAKTAVESEKTIKLIMDQLGDSTAFISLDENNRLKLGSDGGFYVSNDFDPDPLAHYILAKG